MPCSKAVAAAMRHALDTPLLGSALDSGTSRLSDAAHELAVVEFGPGTGRITERLHPDNLTLVETDQAFCELLAHRYPKATVLNVSAIDFLAKQTTPVSVISSIPLLNNPHSNKIKMAVATSYRAGIIQKLVTYSYGPKSPYAECGFAHETRFKQVLRNLPPANIWVYA
jgi:phospholipid N-methyltransferase